MAKKNKNIKDDAIYGFNIYEDKKGRLIYYDMFKKRAVFIPTFDYKQFSFYRYRYLMAVSAFIVLQTLLAEWLHLHFLVPVCISLAVLILMEIKFRRFLSEKQVVKHFNKEECTGYMDVLNTQDPSKMGLKVVLYCALGILLVINAYDKQYDTFILVCCWAIAIVCIIYSLIQLFAMSRRKQKAE